MQSISTKKLSYSVASLWKSSIEQATNVCPVLYISVGNHIPYTNESSPPDIVDTISSEKEIWDNMFAAKRVTGNDVQLVLPRINWTANTKYRQYDDTTEFSELISSNTSLNLKPMYVVTSDRNVYKCLSNSVSANSTVEPSGDYTTSNGNIATADGYVWKYMYNIKPSNKFLTTDWMPAPTTTSALDYGVSSLGVVDGELTTIVVTDNGSNYREASNIRVDGFSVGQSSVRLSNTSLTLSIFSIDSLSNLANMKISGTGFATDTYITTISNTTGVLTLSANTTNFGGNANNISISTRVYIDGDGIGAVANAVISNTDINVADAEANIARINVTTIGTNYSRANAFVYGSGSGANARVILSPKFGHAFNSAKELGSNSAMIAVKIGEIDSTENGLISVDTSFRQVALMRDPYKYGAANSVTTSSANSVISQTTDLSIIAGLNFTLNEFVYQGSVDSPSAYGFVHAQTTNEVRLTKVKGTFVAGLSLIGANSGVTRTITAVTNPELQPYTGDVVYVQNAVKTDRTDGQAEDIKLTISF